MLIRVGYELVFTCLQTTPMILMVNVHYSRASDIVVPDCLTTDPETPITAYRDGFGNWCSRIVAPVGRIRLKIRWSFCWAVVIARPIYCHGRRGRDSVRPRRDGRALRRSAILSTTISRSIISKRAPRGQLGRRSTRV